MASSSFNVSEFTIQSKNMVCRLNGESVSLFLIRFNGESPEQEKGREEVSIFQDITRQKKKTCIKYLVIIFKNIDAVIFKVIFIYKCIKIFFYLKKIIFDNNALK
ncbi:hypothetical protein NC652_009258 [Populus alba x Populus x berolinensis]|nr:hypothetical protein NC652_009258 [Populus alba x Populus x berolinensis]